jgi:hypothetical protein
MRALFARVERFRVPVPLSAVEVHARNLGARGHFVLGFFGGGRGLMLFCGQDVPFFLRVCQVPGLAARKPRGKKDQWCDARNGRLDELAGVDD